MASGKDAPPPPGGSFLGSLRAWLAGLFGRFRAREAPDPAPKSLLEKIVLQALRGNLALPSGDEPRIEMTRLGREGLASFIESFERGYVLSCHEVSDELPRCLYCFTRSALSSLASRYAGTRSESASPAFAEAAVLRVIDGNLSRLFSARPAKDAEGKPGFVFPQVMRVPKSSTADARDELFWLADSLNLAWKISVDRIAFHLLVPTAFDKRVARWAAESGAFLDGVKRGVLAPPAEGDAPEEEDGGLDLEIRILKSAEFALGSLFLPPSLKTGASLFRTRFTTLRAFACRGSPFKDDRSLWIFVTLEIQGFRTPYLYRVADLAIEDFRREIPDPKGFLAALLEANLRYIRGKKPGLEVRAACRICAPPVLPPGARLAVLSAEMRSPRGKMRWETILSTSILNRLSETFFDPWELAYYRATSRNLLLAILSLSRELFRRGMRRNFASIEGCIDEDGGVIPISNLPFHEFVDIIDDHDLLVIVQNHLLPTIGLGGVLGLLHVARQAGIGRLDFDEAKFMRSLNDSGRDLWRAISERSDFPSVDERAFDGRNTRVMNGICEAMLADKLELSFRARCVLEQQFLGPLKEQQAEELRRLEERRVPVASLEGLDPSRRKALVARSARKLLALCFLSHSDRIGPFFGSMMSATGVAELRDDVAMLERRRSAGELDLGKAIEAKMGVEESIVEDLLSETLIALAPEGAAKALRRIPFALIAASLAVESRWRSPLGKPIRDAFGEEGERRLKDAIFEMAVSYPGIAERMAAVDAKHRLIEGLRKG